MLRGVFYDYSKCSVDPETGCDGDTTTRMEMNQDMGEGGGVGEGPSVENREKEKEKGVVSSCGHCNTFYCRSSPSLICRLESFEEGLELCGHSAGEETSAGDALECQSKCEAEESCHFFTYYGGGEGEGGRCLMKDRDGMCDSVRVGGGREVLSGPKKCTVE